MIIHEAFQGAIPANYKVVHRWINQQELKLWTKNITHIPTGLGADGRIYVVEPTSQKPGGTGTFRVEFSVPMHMLHSAGRSGWYQILGPVENTPILNLRVVRP